MSEPKLKGRMYEKGGKLYRVNDLQQDISREGTVFVSVIQVSRQYVNEVGELCWGHYRWIFYSKDIERRINQYECEIERGGAA